MEETRLPYTNAASWAVVFSYLTRGRMRGLVYDSDSTEWRVVWRRSRFAVSTNEREADERTDQSNGVSRAGKATRGIRFGCNQLKRRKSLG
jgi:hypothetical protein